MGWVARGEQEPSMEEAAFAAWIIQVTRRDAGPGGVRVPKLPRHVLILRTTYRRLSTCREICQTWFDLGNSKELQDWKGTGDDSMMWGNEIWGLLDFSNHVRLPDKVESMIYIMS